MMMLMNRILMKKILTMMTIMMARRSHMSVLLALLYPIVVDSTLKPGGVESRYHHVCDYRFYDDDDNDDDDDDDDDDKDYQQGRMSLVENAWSDHQVESSPD